MPKHSVCSAMGQTQQLVQDILKDLVSTSIQESRHTDSLIESTLSMQVETGAKAK